MSFVVFNLDYIILYDVIGYNLLKNVIGTPVIKVSRTQDYGATVKIVGNNYDEAFDACKLAVDESGGTLIHPFDDKSIIAGIHYLSLSYLVCIFRTP